MPDQTTPPTETEQTLARLTGEVRQELATLTGTTTDAVFNAVRAKLETLYHAAETAGRDTAPIVAAYESIQALHNQADTAIDLAAAARAVSEELSQKLDLSAGQLHKIREDRDDILERLSYGGYGGHPELEDLADHIEEHTIEAIFERGGYVMGCVGCAVLYGLTNEHEDPRHHIGHDEGAVFHSYLTDGRDQLTQDERHDLIRFIHSFVNRVEDRRRDEIDAMKAEQAAQIRAKQESKAS